MKDEKADQPDTKRDPVPSFLKAALLLLPLFLVSCGEQFHWRQKLTVTVETPSGEVSGAAVTEVFTRSIPNIFPDGGSVESSLQGEAVVVEVLPGQYMFALITDGLAWVNKPYGASKPGSVYEENMRFIMRQVGEPPVPMPQDSLPVLVTFEDINDPTTVRAVDPNNLAASFGPGVRLKSVTLQITREPVTEGKVEAVLGWVSDDTGRRLLKNIRSMDFSTEAQLEHGAFVRRQN